MKIAIIGAGNVGQALGSSFTKAGHDVTITASSAESAQQKAAQTGARPAPTNREAAEAADVIVLAVWYNAEADIAREIQDAAKGKVVVELANPLTPDMQGLATEGGPSAAERLAELLPGARVVKAFNTLFATVQADPGVHAVAADALIAADDADAKRTVMELAESIGLRAVDAGPLRNARYLEALGFLGITLNASNGWGWNTVWKLVGAPVPEPAGTPVGAGS